MPESNILFALMQKALQIVSQEGLTDTLQDLEKLDHEIKQLEQQIVLLGEHRVCESGDEPVDQALDSLRFQKASLEASLDRSNTELSMVKDKLAQEKNKRSELAKRLDQLEQKTRGLLRDLD